MKKVTQSYLLLAIVLPMLLIGICTPERSVAEVSEVRIAKQYGLTYLPLIIIEEQKLIEKHAHKAGLGDVKVTWQIFGGGSATNDALISNAVDFSASGVAPLIILWAKSSGQYKGVAAISSSPMYLNTVNPEVKSVKDFTQKDRIALPAVKVSIQAIALQMAAAKAFGDNNFAKLDPLTVSMKHPDAMTALLSEGSEVTAHLTTPPYSFRELNNPRVRKLFSSYDLVGGQHTQILIASSNTFRQKNPRTVAVVLSALEDADLFIKKNRKAAAELYLKSTNSKEKLEDILAELNSVEVGYSTTPQKITKFSDFMYKTKTIEVKPKSWKELFFDNIYQKQGS